MSDCLEVGLKKICRSCLKSCDTPINIFTSPEVINDKSINECLSEICGILVSADDNLPECLCAKCLKLLVSSFQFRCEVRRNDCFLRKIIEGEQIKVEDNESNDMNISISFKKRSTNIETSNQESVKLDEETNLDKMYDAYIVEPTIPSLLQLTKQTSIGSDKTKIIEQAVRLKCNLCAKSFSHSKNVRAHEKRHIQKGQHVCNLCKKSFHTSFNLNRHKKMHSISRSLACDFCDKNYATKPELNRHMSTLHYSKQSYECKICQKLFGTKTNLKYHVDAVHENIRNYECSVCKKRFATMAKVRRHQKCFSCLPESKKNKNAH